MLVNSSKGAVIANKVVVADTFWTRFRGLMGKSTMETGSCLLLKPCNAVHTCFMRFPIDVLFLDGAGVVLHIVKDLGSFRTSPIIRKACCVVELPVGSIDATGTEKGDRCIFK